MLVVVPTFLDAIQMRVLDAPQVHEFSKQSRSTSSEPHRHVMRSGIFDCYFNLDAQLHCI
jgi:hypothetical protein